MSAPAYEDLYALSNDREKQLWKDAIFVFDSSAILNFYFLPVHKRTEVFKELFSGKLKGRLWLPSHAKFEFEKNRGKVIKKPITESYDPIEEKGIKKIKESIKDLENQLLGIKNSTEKDSQYPFLPQDAINLFIEAKNAFKKQFDEFEGSIKKQIEAAKNDIKNVDGNDDVIVAIGGYFEIGRDYPFVEILEIVDDGEFRYKHSIPPGYKDAESKEKIGTQIYGDLIIWKQILEYAREVNKPIVFICDDVKEDWCEFEKTQNDRIKSPRHELIKEFFDETKLPFWMYTLSQFLYHSNEYLSTKINQNDINTLANVVNEPTPIIKYVSWGGSYWHAKIEIRDNTSGLDSYEALSTPLFRHISENSTSTHTDSIMNYINDKGEEVTAQIRSYFDTSGNISYTFMNRTNGSAIWQETADIKYVDWDGVIWRAVLTEVDLFTTRDPEIKFICERIVE